MLLFTSLAVILGCFYGMLDVAMAKKFELKNPSDFISVVTGQDLCLWQNILQGTIIAATVLLLFCIYQVALNILPGN